MARTIRSAQERFQAKTRQRETGCIEWTGALTSTGYGSFYAAPGEYIPAHRWAYTQSKGEIPKGMQLDHLCRNRSCVNPDHLEPVTVRENLLRGNTVTARNRAVTHCPAGHEYTPENTYVAPGSPGNRHCKTCIHSRSLARKFKKEW